MTQLIKHVLCEQEAPSSDAQLLLDYSPLLGRQTHRFLPRCTGVQKEGRREVKEERWKTAKVDLFPVYTHSSIMEAW